MALAGKALGSFLDEPHLAHFATIGPDGKPRVRPLWCCFAEGALWFTTRLEARRTGADVYAHSVPGGDRRAAETLAMILVANTGEGISRRRE